jgi:hypothetical protein
MPCIGYDSFALRLAHDRSMSAHPPIGLLRSLRRVSSMGISSRAKGERASMTYEANVTIYREDTFV